MGEGNVVNQVEYEYNGWGRVAREYQEHDGAIDQYTPYLGYTYDDGASGGVAKYVRLSQVTYPDGREAQYGYGTTQGIGDIMSRLANVGDGTDTAHTDPLGEQAPGFGAEFLQCNQDCGQRYDECMLRGKVFCTVVCAVKCRKVKPPRGSGLGLVCFGACKEVYEEACDADYGIGQDCCRKALVYARTNGHWPGVMWRLFHGCPIGI